MSIRSMTGFARVSRATPAGELIISIKSVNHRGLDMHFHLPPEFDSVEPAMRTALRKRVSRGHVQVQLFLKRNGNATSAAAINEALLASWLDAFRGAAARLGLDSRPDLNQALRIPGMIEQRVPENAGDSLETETLATFAAALDELDRFRAREGEAIEAEIRARAQSIRSLVEAMESIRSRALPHFQSRLRERIAELLNGAHLDPGRLAQEAALIAERTDISEELVRLRTHADQTDALLAASGESGKKLDFLLQEMNRETNTILSKTGGIGEAGLTLTDLGLAAKAEIDRIREQSLNVE
jgi:uncharacterized protein (TIGR00255 family)